MSGSSSMGVKGLPPKSAKPSNLSLLQSSTLDGPINHLYYQIRKDRTPVHSCPLAHKRIWTLAELPPEAEEGDWAPCDYSGCNGYWVAQGQYSIVAKSNRSTKRHRWVRNYLTWSVEERMDRRRRRAGVTKPFSG